MEASTHPAAAATAGTSEGRCRMPQYAPQRRYRDGPAAAKKNQAAIRCLYRFAASGPSTRVRMRSIAALLGDFFARARAGASVAASQRAVAAASISFGRADFFAVIMFTTLRIGHGARIFTMPAPAVRRLEVRPDRILAISLTRPASERYSDFPDFRVRRSIETRLIPVLDARI